MRFAFFVHSAVSDWNHGNAHFLRGLMSALTRIGHSVASYEPRGAWSLQNLLEGHGIAPVVEFAREYPEIEVHSYDPAGPELADEIAAACAAADVVVVHEWNAPALANLVARHAERTGVPALFHDTHHRAWSDPGAIARFDLAPYEGVIAFGEVLRRLYRERFGVRRAWTMHEAADHLRFRPLELPKHDDVVWIGNWGDDERSDTLRDYWLACAAALPELRFSAYGVRYPDDALVRLRAAGVEYRGWAPSLRVPELFARARATLHLPRRAYVDALPGIPTIRVFEALACGIPLVSTPWRDSEGLFRPGDFAVAESPAAMRQALAHLAGDAEDAARQAERGRETILQRHTCDHRARELVAILDELSGAGSAGTLAQPEPACN